ncbi:hypothetical protein C8R44DRAFT_895238 [Mycena epipterygia]|nr:hypothetical protein C8R44DRAFT_895238 [Mycena epipterygia]
MSENEEAPTPSDPDWMRGTLSCIADCGTTALLSALKVIFFAILPLKTMFLLLALPFLGSHIPCCFWCCGNDSGDAERSTIRASSSVRARFAELKYFGDTSGIPGILLIT